MDYKNHMVLLESDDIDQTAMYGIQICLRKSGYATRAYGGNYRLQLYWLDELRRYGLWDHEWYGV